MLVQCRLGYVGLKAISLDDISEPGFYGDLVCKFKELKRKNDFSSQLIRSL